MAKSSVDTLISGSVGLGGINIKNDVLVVEFLFGLLESRSKAVAPRTLVAKIQNFQMTLKYGRADGKIDVGGKTLKALVQKAATLRLGPNDTWEGRPDLMMKIDRALHEARRHNNKRHKVTAAGGTSKLTDADFTAAATALQPGVQVAMIRAFAEVESGGKSGFGASGLPIIAFEGHIFRKYTNHIYDLTHPLLSYVYVKKAGDEWQKNNADQTTAWATLKEAMDLDHDAALMACSWGMFQVMGFNYATCGYADVDSFVESMKAGERGQLDAFVGYCKKAAGLRQALADKDFAKCASLYNGSDYGDYDKRIEKAFKAHGGT